MFEPTEDCSKAVQSKTLSAIDAKKATTTTADSLERLRDDDRFDRLYDDCVEQAERMGVDQPRLPRRVRPLRRYDDGDPGYHPQDCRDKYRQLYNEFIETAVSTIRQRFNNPSYELFSAMEAMLLQAATTGLVNHDSVKFLCDHFGNDIQSARLQRQLAVLCDICASKDVADISDIVHSMREMGAVATMLTEVVQLLQLYLVMPASVATAERSFSTLRRMKTYLRSTMTAQRLNAVMILNVHRELANKLCVKDVMHEFIVRNDIRKDTFGIP